MCICVYICIFNINTMGWGTRKRSQEREWNQVCDGFTCDILNQLDTWRNEKQLKRGVCQLVGCTDKWLKYQKGNSEKEKNTNKSQTQWMTFDDTEEGTEYWTKRGQKFRREKETGGKHNKYFQWTYHIFKLGLITAIRVILKTSLKSLWCFLLKMCSNF